MVFLMVDFSDIVYLKIGVLMSRDIVAWCKKILCYKKKSSVLLLNWLMYIESL